MCKLLRSVIIDNDYKAERTIKETVRCRLLYFISNLKKNQILRLGSLWLNLYYYSISVGGYTLVSKDCPVSYERDVDTILSI